MQKIVEFWIMQENEATNRNSPVSNNSGTECVNSIATAVM